MKEVLDRNPKECKSAQGRWVDETRKMFGLRWLKFAQNKLECKRVGKAFIYQYRIYYT